MEYYHTRDMIKHFLFFDIKSFIVLSFLVCSFSVIAQVRLPSVLSDNMVLKQNSTVELRGWVDHESPVEVIVSWIDSTYHVEPDSNNFFTLKVPTSNAGGPYFIEFTNNNHLLRLENILLGEVWLGAGQSNMEMPLKGFPNQPVTNADSIIKRAENGSLRIFTTSGQVSWKPQKDVEGKWVAASPQTAPHFSALAFEFGQRLQDTLKVPVGIIVSAWGGTPIQSWMPASALEVIDLLPFSKPDTITSRSPAALYNGMLAPYEFLNLSGFLWYQGESNHREPDLYRELQPLMITHLRQAFDQPDLPFFFVQIAPWFYDPTDPPYAPYFREVQFEVSELIPSSGIAISMDAGSDKTIHPPNKSILADRLVRLALAKTYGRKDIEYQGPKLESYDIIGRRIFLNFPRSKKLILIPTETPTFELAGADGVFRPAKVEIRGNRIEVSHPDIKVPKAVRYGWKNFIQGNLYDETGLPASSFRTDDWPLESK